jgi:hypothetical protein
MKTKHKDILEYYITEHLESLDSTGETKDLTEKLDAVIERLINKEGILFISTDNDEKLERVLSLNVNYDAPIFS